MDDRAYHELNQRLAEVYPDLRALAAARLAGEPVGHTLNPTALVHEVYLRLAGRAGGWAGREHLLATAARVMRQVLTDHARRVRRAKRGGGRPASLDGHDPPAPEPAADDDAAALAAALAAFAREEPGKARLVELRAFGGLSLEDAADAAGVSRATAARHWAYAKAWLFDRLTAAEGGR